MGVDLIGHGGASFNWDCWRKCLDIAIAFGWQPAGTIAPPDYDGDWNGGYCSNDFQEVSDSDARALGVARARHHRFLMNDGSTRGVLLYAEDECVGYTYVADGHIGPLAVTHQSALGAAFRTALVLAAAGAAQHVSAFVPGPCEAALSTTIDHGMRVTIPMVFDVDK